CCAWELSDPTAEDKVPIRLQNNAVTRPLNMVTEMYSLPDYRNVDPNPLIAPFFCIFFGMMFNDLGYGLVFIILSLIVQKKFKLTGGTKNMIRLVLECGVTTAIFGIITGSFFGDAIPVVAKLLGKEVTIPSLLNPLADPMSVLILSLVLGVIQILFGMGVKAYILIRDGKPLDALFDVGSWWLLFAGIAVGALRGFWWIAIAGVAALVLTQGRAKPTIPGKIVGGIASLYDITSYFSDILSYSRLMALMLAGGIVASIVNVLGSLFGSVILFIPIFVIGHVFNIGINVIGTYVHAARLSYQMKAQDAKTLRLQGFAAYERVIVSIDGQQLDTVRLDGQGLAVLNLPATLQKETIMLTLSAEPGKQTPRIHEIRLCK
ncbi:MAG: hypothetical protein IIZ86_00070, partial [Firmicutes bacterium]|nr:hypothetical protein [Bacillota bacterium]